MPVVRVVLDTNVLVSGLAYPQSIPGKIVKEWRSGGLKVSLPRYILDEMVRVLPRLPRVTLSTEEIRDLAESFIFLADIVEPDTEWNPSLRDPADQPVLATLKTSGADWLITGDKDLLALGAEFPILTPSAFWSKLTDQTSHRDLP